MFESFTVQKNQLHQFYQYHLAIGWLLIVSL